VHYRKCVSARDEPSDYLSVLLVACGNLVQWWRWLEEAVVMLLPTNFLACHKHVPNSVQKCKE